MSWACPSQGDFGCGVTCLREDKLRVLQFVIRCVTIVTCLARLVKCVNPTRGRPWFFTSVGLEVFSTKKSCVLYFHIQFRWIFASVQLRNSLCKQGLRLFARKVAKISHHNSPTSCGCVLTKFNKNVHWVWSVHDVNAALYLVQWIWGLLLEKEGY